MRDFAKINPSLWASKKFQSLDDTCRLFYVYCLTSPSSNSCGCYRLPFGYISSDIGADLDSIKYRIDTVSDTGLIRYDFTESVIYIQRWYDFNPPNNPKHCLKIIGELSNLPDCENKSLSAKDLHDFVCNMPWDTEMVISKIQKFFQDTVYYTVSDTVSRVGDTRQDKTKTRQDKTRPEQKTPLWWEGDIIRLNKKDYETFFSYYQGSDEQFMEWLKSRDQWLATQPPEKRASWFVSTKRALEKIKAGSND